MGWAYFSFISACVFLTQPYSQPHLSAYNHNKITQDLRYHLEPVHNNNNNNKKQYNGFCVFENPNMDLVLFLKGFTSRQQFSVGELTCISVHIFDHMMIERN